MDREELSKQREKATSLVAAIGIIANAVLLLAKLAVGFAFQSSGMISDGLNSAGDVFSSSMTLIGSKISARPRDEGHPYGHGKAEHIFSFFISLSLLFVAVSSFWGSLRALLSGSDFTFSWLLIATSVFTIATKAGLYFYAGGKARQYNSLLIKANSYDHRNDVLLTGGTLVGIICGAIGLLWVDGLVGMLISLWIGWSGLVVFREAFHVLMDGGVNKGFQKHLTEDILAVEGVDHIDVIRTTPIGMNHLVIVEISVDRELTVGESHSIAERVEQCILADHDDIAEVIVHINPAEARVLV